MFLKVVELAGKPDSLICSVKKKSRFLYFQCTSICSPVSRQDVRHNVFNVFATDWSKTLATGWSKCPPTAVVAKSSSSYLHGHPTTKDSYFTAMAFYSCGHVLVMF